MANVYLSISLCPGKRVAGSEQWVPLALHQQLLSAYVTCFYNNNNTFRPIVVSCMSSADFKHKTKTAANSIEFNIGACVPA